MKCSAQKQYLLTAFCLLFILGAKIRLEKTERYWKILMLVFVPDVFHFKYGLLPKILVLCKIWIFKLALGSLQVVFKDCRAYSRQEIYIFNLQIVKYRVEIFAYILSTCLLYLESVTLTHSTVSLPPFHLHIQRSGQCP